MSSKLTNEDLNKIKNILQNKICPEAADNGHYEIAQIIRGSIHKLNKSNVEYVVEKEVSIQSSDVKDRAKVFLFIQTKFPDWFDIDRKILLDKVNEIEIYAGFSEAKYPVDENINEFIKLGVKYIGLVPGLPSINISNEEVTFYYISDPFSNDSESRSEDRLAITIKNKVGKNLVHQLKPLYLGALKKSIDNEVLPLIETRMRKALIKIQQNKEEIKAIHDLIDEDDLNLWERVCISIFLLELNLENVKEYVSLKEIEKDTGLEEEEIRKELEKVRSQFEYESTVLGRTDKIKFKQSGMYKWMPRLLFDIISGRGKRSKYWTLHKINKIREKYNLFLSDITREIEPPKESLRA